jgi:hypothetical protein
MGNAVLDLTLSEALRVSAAATVAAAGKVAEAVVAVSAKIPKTCRSGRRDQGLGSQVAVHKECNPGNTRGTSHVSNSDAVHQQHKYPAHDESYAVAVPIKSVVPSSPPRLLSGRKQALPITKRRFFSSASITAVDHHLYHHHAPVHQQQAVQSTLTQHNPMGHHAIAIRHEPYSRALLLGGSRR